MLVLKTDTDIHQYKVIRSWDVKDYPRGLEQLADDFGKLLVLKGIEYDVEYEEGKKVLRWYFARRMR
jgi:hypothetical protein